MVGGAAAALGVMSTVVARVSTCLMTLVGLGLCGTLWGVCSTGLQFNMAWSHTRNTIISSTGSSHPNL